MHVQRQAERVVDVGDRVDLGVHLRVGVRRGVAAAVVVGQQHRLERQPVDHHLPPGRPAPAERRDGEEHEDAGVDPEPVGRDAHQLDEHQQPDGVRREGGVAHVAPAPSGPAHPLGADDAVAGLLGEVRRGHPAMLTGERSQTRLGAMSTRAQRYDAVVLSRARISPHLLRLTLSVPGLESTGIADEWVGLVVPGQFQVRYYTVRSLRRRPPRARRRRARGGPGHRVGHAATARATGSWSPAPRARSSRPTTRPG